jgi:hypothetical protein
VKALSVRQPWAGLIASGKKDLEIRSRNIKYRGELLICAASSFATSPSARVHLGSNVTGERDARFPRGVAVAIVNVVDSIAFTRELAERACVSWRPEDHTGMMAWVFELISPVYPIKVKGSLSLFNVDDSLIKRRA